MPLYDVSAQHSTSRECVNVAKTAAPVSSVRLISSEQKFCFTPSDFQWPGSKHFGVQQNNHELSEFDKELHRTWDAAVDAGHFSYKLDCMETRMVSGKYSLLVQLNESRFTKRRKPDPMASVSQAFNPAKFNFTKVPSKEVMFELCPRHRAGASESEHNVLIINISPLDYGHCLLIPGVNLCQPQVLTETAILLGLETFLLSNHRGFHLGFNSLCAYASVNHLHFHVWYNEYPSYLESADVSPVCDDLFEVKNYATTAFVFELRPDSDVVLLASKIYKVTSYLVKNEVAHNLHIMRGEKCSSAKQVNGLIQHHGGDTVVRVFLWPRIPVTGAKVKSSYDSGERPMALCEFAGCLAVETRETYDSFTEDQFCEFMRRATLPEEEFIQLKVAVQKLLTNCTED